MIINKTLTFAVALLGHAAVLFGLTGMASAPPKPEQVVMLIAPAPVPMGEDVPNPPVAKPKLATPKQIKPLPQKAVTPVVAKKSVPAEVPAQQSTGQMETAATTSAAPSPAAAETVATSAGSHSSKQSADEMPVTPPLFNAAYLANPRPAYPSQSMALGEKGRVLLKVKVSEAGLPIEVELARSSGYRRLDDAAKKAVERWKFVPGRRGETAIVMSALVPVDFVI